MVDCLDSSDSECNEADAVEPCPYCAELQEFLGEAIAKLRQADPFEVDERAVRRRDAALEALLEHQQTHS